MAPKGYGLGATSAEAVLASVPLGRREQILALAAEQFGTRGYTRTSLQDIANAGGIQPGSLYHHFESKEAIARELVGLYRTELEAIAKRAFEQQDGGDPAIALYEQLAGLAAAVAESSVRHQAAVRLSIYELSARGLELPELPGGVLSPVEEAMTALLQEGRSRRFLRTAVDPSVLARQICTTMRRVGAGVPEPPDPIRPVTLALLHTLLAGLNRESLPDSALDRSPAFAAARRAVDAWTTEVVPDGTDKLHTIRSAARLEFARRGYEAATMRDIVRQAGMSMGAVYRLVDSKETLLRSIMGSYYARLSSAYDAVLTSGSRVTEQIDALTWIQINAMEMFEPEFEIQHAWFREIPPEVDIFSEGLSVQYARIRSAITDGLESSELRVWDGGCGPDPDWATIVACLSNLMWIPADIVSDLGGRATLRHSRETTLRGAASVLMTRAVERTASV